MEGFLGEWEVEADRKTESYKRHRGSSWDSGGSASLPVQGLGARPGSLCSQNLGWASSGGDGGRLRE